MRVLALVHGDIVGPSLFADVIEQAGHDLDVVTPASWSASPGDPGHFDALLAFGGVMHANEEAEHPWLREENAFLRQALDAGIPTLGICLGAQLLAKAAGSSIGPAPEPEVGWHEVELTDAARRDPLFGSMPESFHAFEWHYYAYSVPSGGVELARSAVCTQAFRIGERAWGVSFHPEVTAAQIEEWLDLGLEMPVSPRTVERDTRQRIDRWNELGRSLCQDFLSFAQRVSPT
ncbi:MAG: type 1 glutamine amidotransferase [Actinomycetota bacterium]